MASTRTLAKKHQYVFSAKQQQNYLRFTSCHSFFSCFLIIFRECTLIPYGLLPPVALFLGLSFALLCGQAHPKFNKNIKYLLQYSVVGLGFGMNLQASLASGKEGMEFTVISVVGTLLIGWVIGRKFLKVDRDTSYLISSGGYLRW